MGSASIEGRVLADTSAALAILSETDSRHTECASLLPRIRGRLLTCWPVITEAAWMLRHDLRTLKKLLASCNGGLFELAHVGEADITEITAILTKYSDLRIQLADAALVHLANREGIDTIFTLDRRDFSVMRGTRGKKFRIIP